MNAAAVSAQRAHAHPFPYTHAVTELFVAQAVSAEISALNSDLDALCDAGLIQRFRDDRGVEYFRLVEGVVPE
jgi:hypothetical protein